MAQAEVVALGVVEQREEADDAVRQVADRHRQDLERRHLVGAGRDLVDDHRAPLQLRPRQQVAVRAGDDAGLVAAALVALRADDRDRALRDDQRADRAAEVVDGRLHEAAQLVRHRAACRRFSTEASSSSSRSRSREDRSRVIAPSEAAQCEVALQAFERGAQQPEHQRHRPRLAAFAGQQPDDGERQALLVAHQEGVGVGAVEGARGAVDVVRALGVAVAQQFLGEAVHVRVVLAARDPQRRAADAVDGDRLRARKQHLDELSVRVEARQRRIGLLGDSDHLPPAAGCARDGRRNTPSSGEQT